MRLPHGLVAPEIQEHASPSGRIVVPELLEVFLEQIGAHGLQIVAEQIAQAELLLRGEIVLAFEHAPAGFLQQRLMALLSHPARFGGADFVQGFVHLGDDVEAVEDVQRLRAFLTDHVQVGLPHIRADELDLHSELLSDGGEEALEALEGAFLADPDQAGKAWADLVDQPTGIYDLWRIGFHPRRWRGSTPAYGAPDPSRPHTRRRRTPYPKRCGTTQRSPSKRVCAPSPPART